MGLFTRLLLFLLSWFPVIFLYVPLNKEKLSLFFSFTSLEIYKIEILVVVYYRINGTLSENCHDYTNSYLFLGTYYRYVKIVH